MATVDVLLPGYSFGTSSGRVAFCSVTLVESGGRRVLVDTGHAGRRRELMDALARRGLGEGDVDAVFMTHAHWDHVQNFDLFSGAPVLLHPVEHAYAAAPHANDWATPRWTGAAVATHRVQEVREGDELAAGVTVIELPGHSPGSMGLLVETDDGVAAVAGDALHSGPVALRGEAPLVFFSPTRARESIARVLGAADVVYPGHDRPFRVRSGAIDYLAPFTLELHNLEPGQEGLSFRTLPPSTWVMPGANP